LQIKILLIAAVLCFVEWINRNRVHAFDVSRWNPVTRWSFY